MAGAVDITHGVACAYTRPRTHAAAPYHQPTAVLARKHTHTHTPGENHELCGPLRVEVDKVHAEAGEVAAGKREVDGDGAAVGEAGLLEREWRAEGVAGEGDEGACNCRQLGIGQSDNERHGRSCAAWAGWVGDGRGVRTMSANVWGDMDDNSK